MAIDKKKSDKYSNKVLIHFYFMPIVYPDGQRYILVLSANQVFVSLTGRCRASGRATE